MILDLKTNRFLDEVLSILWELDGERLDFSHRLIGLEAVSNGEHKWVVDHDGRVLSGLHGLNQLDLNGHVSSDNPSVALFLVWLIKVDGELVHMAGLFKVLQTWLFESQLVDVLDLVLVYSLTINNSHLCGVSIDLRFLRYADVYPHFEASLLLALLIKQELDEIDSVRFLVIQIEVVKIVDLEHFSQVVRNQKTFAYIILVKHKTVLELFLWLFRVIDEHLLDICELAIQDVPMEVVDLL